MKGHQEKRCSGDLSVRRPRLLQCSERRMACRHIDLVRVYLWDVNGPRGGMGKKCRIVVELPPRGRVVVTGTDADVRFAITGTANRAGFAVKRHVKRRRARRRSPRRRVRGLPLVAG
jgi:hypothetical protein